MIKTADYNLLKAVKQSPLGMIFGIPEDTEGIEVLLPKKEVTGYLEIGDSLELFVYTGTDNQFFGTTHTPLLKVGEFGFLKAKEVTNNGAFFEWGIPKDLFVPFSEQTERMIPGKYYLVYLFIDQLNGRPLGSTRIEKFIERDNVELAEKQEVEILLWEETKLGLKVIINNKYQGVLYHNEIFRDVKIGERTKGYIKRIREDKKIDVSLERTGFGRVDPGTKRILEALNKHNGFLPLHDNSDPEEIKEALQMSKKTFKKAVGALYKSRLITLEKDGIRLV